MKMCSGMFCHVALIMEAVNASEKLLNVYQTKRCNISEANHVESYVLENFQPKCLAPSCNFLHVLY